MKAVALPRVLAYLAGGSLAVSIIFSELTHGHPSSASSVSPAAIIARYELPDDLVEVTDSPFSGRDPVTGLPRVVETRSTKIRLFLVPPGVALLGSSDGDDDERFGSLPTPRPVFISAFYISDTVPNELYERCEPGHRKHRGEYSRKDRMPATRVSWKEARSFAATWLCKEEKVATNSYRLPREMEQEKAVRGGFHCARYPWGCDDMDPTVKTLYSDSSAIEVDAGPSCGYGLHSPTENVFCWMEDWMGPYPGTMAALSNPTGPRTGKKKAIRGGTWHIYGMSFRCADRWEAFPDLADDHVSFRIVRELPVPADLPIWTGRPSPAGTATRQAILSQVSLSSAGGSFCIEEAYRALRARADAAGVALDPWPQGAPDSPEDGFYCEALSQDPSTNTHVELVQALATQLSNEELLGHYVVEGGGILSRLSTNTLEVVTEIATTNYLAKFQILSGYIEQMDRIAVAGVAVNIQSTPSSVVGFRDFRQGGALSRTNAGEARYIATTNRDGSAWTTSLTGVLPPTGSGIGPGVQLTGYMDCARTPQPNLFLYSAWLRSERGRAMVDLSGFTTGGQSQVYLSISPAVNGMSTNSAAPSAPVTADGLLRAWGGEMAMAGQLTVSSLTMGDANAVLPDTDPAPPLTFGQIMRLTQGWILSQILTPAIPKVPKLEKKCPVCAGATTPIIYFTQPTNGTNLTACVGNTNILECKVTLGNADVVDGEVKWEAPAALGSFSNNVHTVALGADGMARTAWIGTAPGTGEIKATGQNLKDPADHTTVLPNTTTNIVADVVAVDSVTFVQAGTTGDLSEDNPNGGAAGVPAFGGGWRFFPDATFPTNASRNKVRVRAVLTSTLATATNVPVYFRCFDVDDPSTNATLDPNGALGEDNRGTVTGAGMDTPGTPQDLTKPKAKGYLGRLRPVDPATTNPAGAFEAEGVTIVAMPRLLGGQIVSEVELATSFQPGDNFRVVASCQRPEVNALKDTTSVPTAGNITVAGFTGKVTDQISVWRHLVIEQDSMDAVPVAKPKPDRTVTQGVKWTLGAPVAGQSTLELEKNPPASDDNFYAGGIITRGGVTFPIVSNSKKDVVIRGVPTPAQQALFTTAQFQMVDDDGLLLPPGDVLLPRFVLVTPAVARKYAPAYIELQDANELSINPRQFIPFELNTHSTKSVVLRASKDLKDTPTFWCHLVVSGYQSIEKEDKDPDTEIPELGSTDPLAGDAVSVILLECIRDQTVKQVAGAAGLQLFQEEIAGTTAHETAHPPGGKSAAQDHKEGELMGVGVNHIRFDFTDETIARFRGAHQWQE